MSKQKRETYDVVQWDGLKETAIAFFGMNVLDPGLKDLKYYYDEHNGNLYGQPDAYVSWIVGIGDWLVKHPDGILEISDELFQNEYDIIDEYPA